MNERIRELFKRAGGKTSVRNLASDPVQVVETHELWDDRIEKFAELIIQECAKIADDGFASSNFGNGITGHQLLKHFGVEE